MKKLVSLLMTGVFVLPMTIATLTYAQDAPKGKDEAAATGKKAKKSKGEKKGAKKGEKKGAKKGEAASGM